MTYLHDSSYKRKIFVITASVFLISFAFLSYAYAKPLDDASSAYKRNLKQLESWKKDFTRNSAKYPDIDSSNLKTLLDDYEQILAQSKQAIDAQGGKADGYYNDWWTLNQDMNNLSRDIHDAFLPYQNLKNVTKDLTERGKQLNKIKSKLKGIQKTHDKAVRKYVTEIERDEILAQFKELIAQAQGMIDRNGLILADAQKAAPKDSESYWMNYTDDLNRMQQDFNDLQNKVQQVGDAMNELKGLEQNVQKIEKNIKRYAGTQLEIDGQDSVVQMKDYIQSVWTTLITNPDTVRDNIQSIYDLQKDWDGARQEYDLSQGSNNQKPQQQNQGGQQTQQKQDGTIVKNIGDEIELVTLKYTVNKVEEKMVLTSKYFTPASAKKNAKFVVVDMSIINSTNSSFSFFPNKVFVLIDNKGRQFETYSDFTAVDNYLAVRDLSPGITEQGAIAYEIPSDATSYAIVSKKDGTNEIYKVILK